MLVLPSRGSHRGATPLGRVPSPPPPADLETWNPTKRWPVCFGLLTKPAPMALVRCSFTPPRLWCGSCPSSLALRKEFGLEAIELNQCAFGRRPKDWDPTSGDVRTLLPTTILTNCSFLRMLNEKCVDVARHTHGNSLKGDQACELCDDLKSCMAAAVRTAWLNGARPEPKAFPSDF